MAFWDNIGDFFRDAAKPVGIGLGAAGAALTAPFWAPVVGGALATAGSGILSGLGAAGSGVMQGLGGAGNFLMGGGAGGAGAAEASAGTGAAMGGTAINTGAAIGPAGIAESGAATGAGAAGGMGGAAEVAAQTTWQDLLRRQMLGMFLNQAFGAMNQQQQPIQRNMGSYNPTVYQGPPAPTTSPSSLTNLIYGTSSY